MIGDGRQVSSAAPAAGAVERNLRTTSTRACEAFRIEWNLQAWGGAHVSEPTNYDSSRIILAANGDRLALGQLLAEHYEPLARHLLPRIPESRRAEISVDDLIQESYLHAIRGIEQLEIQTPEGLKAWLISIVDNELQCRLRGVQRVKRGRGRIAAHLDDSATAARADGTNNDETPSFAQRSREDVSAVQMAVANLAGQQSEAVRRHYLDGQSIVETARAMDQSQGAIRGLLQRARQALKKSLGLLWRGERNQSD